MRPHRRHIKIHIGIGHDEEEDAQKHSGHGASSKYEDGTTLVVDDLNGLCLVVRDDLIIREYSETSVKIHDPPMDFRICKLYSEYVCL